MFRRHPLLSASLVILLLACVAGACVWGYAYRQWRAAQVAVKEDRPKEARERLAFCLRLWPRNIEVHLLAARAARLAGDLTAAETHLNRCLELQRGQDRATQGVQLEFYLLRVQTGEVDELWPALIKLVEEGHPESALILETMARAYILHLRYKPAYSCLSEWIKIEPQNAKPYQWRGQVLERLNNEKAAKEDYDRALERDPNLIPVRLRVAEMFLEDKQAPEALPHLEQLYRQAPDDPIIRARLGMCRFLQGRAKEARELMESAVEHLPHDAMLLVSLANLDLQDSRLETAEARLRIVLKSDPSDTEALFVLSSVLQAQGHTKQAAEVLADFERKRSVVERINIMLKEVADSSTARAADHAELGSLFLEIGREKFGTYWLERALELEPENQRARKALATYYEKKGDATNAAVHRKFVRDRVP